MATGATYSVKYRRKREQKTDYRRRLNLLKSGIRRFVVRFTNRYIIAQLIEYREDGDIIAAHANSKELSKMGWAHGTSNTPSAYLTGLLCGVRGKAKGVDKAILDTGLYPQVKGSKIYGALKGLLDAGVESPAGEDIFPSAERIRGDAVASHVQKSKDIAADFDKMKESIMRAKG